MRNLRTWLLLLLVALLPIRAVMAGSVLLCLPQVAEEHHVGHPPSAHDHTRHGSADPDRPGHAHQFLAAQSAEPSHEPPHEPSPAADPDCNLCAGFCSLTPLAPTHLDLRPPQAQAALHPADSAAAPSHVSDGQKRPPRTI